MARCLLVAAAVAITAVVASACGPATTYTPREGLCAPRPPGCDFEVISQRTDRHYQVVGTIDVEAFSVRRLPRDDAAFRAAVGPEVCRAGGDAVIPGITGDGRYVLAAVVKWADEGAAASACTGREHPRGRGRRHPAEAEPAEAATAEASVRAPRPAKASPSCSGGSSC